MEIHQLKYVFEAARYKNISKAAQNLYVSRQAVSKAISSLEHELGHAIFDREQMTLTPFGETAIEHIRNILCSIDSFVTYAHSLDDDYREKPLITIGLTAFPLDYLFFDENSSIVRAITSFEERADCRISLLHFPDSSIIKAVKEKSLDIGIVHGEYEAEDLAFVPFEKADMRIITLKDGTFCESPSVHVSDLENVAIRCPLDFDLFMQQLTKCCIASGFSPLIKEVPLNDTAIECFMKNGGIHIQPFAPSMEQKFPNLAFLPFADGGFDDIPLCLVCRKDKSKSIQRFCSYFLHTVSAFQQ